VTTAFEYARGKALPDVAWALEWLDTVGFTLTAQQGGEHEGFGNVFLQFERGDIGVQITRDRLQWMVVISPPGQKNYPGLNVLLTAMEGGEPEPGPHHVPFSEPLPDQLPEGVVWRSAIPAVIEWMEEADRAASIADSDRRWRKAMIRWWKEV